ncbi:hypothetical protein EAF00_007507 [Botryotinia globosa]|nr:hypothetical protein EAF00_007507 [Botryotinia globosa]
MSTCIGFLLRLKKLGLVSVAESSGNLLLGCFRFHNNNNANKVISTMKAPAPAPIPAFAPVDKDWVVFEEEVVKVDDGRGWYTVEIKTDAWTVLVWTIADSISEVVDDISFEDCMLIGVEDIAVVWEV